MSKRTENISFDSTPVVLVAASKQLVILDPLVLDGIAAALPAQKQLSTVSARAALAPFSGTAQFPMRIGVYEIPAFRPGRFRIEAADIMSVAEGNTDAANAFDVDSGAIVVVDYARLADVARSLTWDKYDLACQSADDRNPVIEKINKKLGVPCFAILSSVEGTEFSGDGPYALKPGALRSDG